MVRQERGARAAFKHGAHARGGESPMDSTFDQRRHHGDHRFGGAAARHAAQVYRSDVVYGVQLRQGTDGVYTVRRLVPAALRDGGAVGAGGGAGDRITVLTDESVCPTLVRFRLPTYFFTASNRGGSPARRRL